MKKLLFISVVLSLFISCTTTKTKEHMAETYRVNEQMGRFVGNYSSKHGKLLLILKDGRGFARLNGQSFFKLEEIGQNKYFDYEQKIEVELRQNKAYVNLYGQNMTFDLLKTKDEDFAQ